MLNSLILVTLVIFCVTAFVLFRFAWKPLLQRLGHREAPDPTPRAEGPLSLALEPAGGTDRCPYCHDEALADELVVCTSCLARHHRECWDGHLECAACGHTERYSGTERTPGRVGAAREDPKAGSLQ